MFADRRAYGEDKPYPCANRGHRYVHSTYVVRNKTRRSNQAAKPTETTIFLSKRSSHREKRRREHRNVLNSRKWKYLRAGRENPNSNSASKESAPDSRTNPRIWNHGLKKPANASENIRHCRCVMPDKHKVRGAKESSDQALCPRVIVSFEPD